MPEIKNIIIRTLKPQEGDPISLDWSPEEKKADGEEIIPISKKRHVDDVFAGLRGRVKYSNPDVLLQPETEEWREF